MWLHYRYRRLDSEGGSIVLHADRIAGIVILYLFGQHGISTMFGAKF